MKKFPLVLQHDTMQCGVACLSMICKYFGRNYSMEYLSNLCNVTLEGVSLLSISESASTIGLHSECARVGINVFQKAPLPCILHWNQEHFVVLYKIKGDRYYIADPGKGLIIYNKQDFIDHWISTRSNNEDKGVAMFLETTPQFYSLKPNMLDYESSNKRSFSFLFGYIKKYSKYFVLLFLGLIVGCLIQLILPFLTQSIVDVGIAYKDLNFIWLILIGQLILTISNTSIDFMRRWLLMHISLRINISLVSDFFIKLLNLPMAFFEAKQRGDILQRMSDHSRINNFLTNQILSVSFAAVSFVIFSLVLFYYNQLIFSVFLLGSTIYGLWISLFLKKRKIIDYDYFEQEAINNDKTYELISSMQEIKLQNCEQRQRWLWEDTQVDLFNIQIKSLKLKQVQEAGCILINETKNLILTIISASAVINGDITLGMMLAIQYIIGQLNSPVDILMDFIYALQDVKISLERINEIHIVKNEDDIVKPSLAVVDFKKGISFKNVMFKYNPHSSHKILDNINIVIPKGKVTAIVGASGSGKTTLIKLLLGFYPALEGRIDIDDYNINDLGKRCWRKKCGVAMQNGAIFSESIARNIAVGDGDIDMDRLLKAARLACVHEFVMNLPLKYNTRIGSDGIELSQGQKQRILIARVIYKDPDFIVLDEATNSLDANNENLIFNNLKEFYKGKTVVKVAHRLSTVKNADQIIVLDHGMVVEMGSHNELISLHGVYYNLVKNQLELGY